MSLLQNENVQLGSSNENEIKALIRSSTFIQGVC